MLIKPVARQQHIDIKSPSAFRYLTDTLFTMLNDGIKRGCRSIVFMCIGTDRSTGDSLGPLIGYKIGNLKYRNVFVYGDLESPVHAKNIDEVMEGMISRHEKPFIVAIDACLGLMEHIGFINIGEGPVKPGSGVSKNLKPVGDMYITGVVNFGGFMDFLILQNTRLGLVMKMADTISLGIKYVLWKISSDPAAPSCFTGVNS